VPKKRQLAEKRFPPTGTHISSEEVSVGLLIDIIYGTAGRSSTERNGFFFYCETEMSCSPSEEAMEKERRR